MLGWSREKIKDYKALEKICKKAWDIIGATFENNSTKDENNTAPINGAKAPTLPFSEFLLRSILQLRPSQQLELVKELADNNII